MKITRNDQIIKKLVGKVGNLVYISKQGNTYNAREIYHDSKVSAKQKTWRDNYNKVDLTWRDLSPKSKEKWNRLPWEKGQTGYSKFMRVNLRRIALGYELLKEPIKQTQKGV